MGLARGFVLRAVVNDGTGIATIWKARSYATKPDELVESIGRVVGVHTEAEALAAWTSYASNCTPYGERSEAECP